MDMNKILAYVQNMEESLEGTPSGDRGKTCGGRGGLR